MSPKTKKLLMAQVRFEAALIGYWCACVLHSEKQLGLGDPKITMHDIAALKHHAWLEMYTHIPPQYTAELRSFLNSQQITLPVK